MNLVITVNVMSYTQICEYRLILVRNKICQCFMFSGSFNFGGGEEVAVRIGVLVASHRFRICFFSDKIVKTE